MVSQTNLRNTTYGTLLTVGNNGNVHVLDLDLTSLL